MNGDLIPALKMVADLGLCLFLVVYMVIRQDRLLRDLAGVCRDIKVLLEQRRN